MVGLQSLQRLGANSWTGGQYSLFRAAFGLYIALHFADLLLSNPWYLSNHWVLETAEDPIWGFLPNVLARKQDPIWVQGTLWSGLALSLPLILGVWPRVVGPLLALLWGQVFACIPGHFHGSLHAIAAILLLQVLVPGRPYGSWLARGRLDPGGEWQMPRPVLALAWCLSGFVVVVWGTSQLRTFELSSTRDIGLGCLAILSPLAFVSLRWRSWAWLALTVLGVADVVIQLSRGEEFSVGWIVVLAFLFDPGWIEPPASRERWVFYDGSCGLCHRFVRFLLAEDDRGAFRYAPLQGETVRERLSAKTIAGLPDSVVLLEGDRVLSRFEAARRVLVCLGGGWRILGTLLGVVPRSLGNTLYDLIARVRHRLFKTPEAACPILPEDLRKRFGA